MSFKQFLALGLLLISSVALASSPPASAAKPHVVYMSPSQASDPFDTLVVELMQAAADDLGMRLSVVNVVSNQVYNQQRIDNIFKLAPDYLILSYQIYSSEVLRQAEHIGIKTMIINSPIPDSERVIIDQPRTVFKSWLGHIYPDDYLAGHQLTQLLQQQLANPSQMPARDELLAFNGHRATSSAQHRQRGLIDAAKELNINIRHVFAADWNPDITTRPLPSATTRYPKVKLFWAASDAIALRIIQHQKAKSLQAGKDYYTAGIDWSKEGLQSIKKGEMSASIGGHFLTGAWAMVQIHDYHHGYDFIDYGAETIIPMAIADRSNIDTILNHLSKKHWNQIDFKTFSQKYQANFSGYDFTVERVFGALPIGK